MSFPPTVTGNHDHHQPFATQHAGPRSRQPRLLAHHLQVLHVSSTAQAHERRGEAHLETQIAAFSLAARHPAAHWTCRSLQGQGARDKIRNRGGVQGTGHVHQGQAQDRLSRLLLVLPAVQLHWLWPVAPLHWLYGVGGMSRHTCRVPNGTAFGSLARRPGV
eukprot:2523274-Prymnesium_polylepis.1